MGAGAFPEHRRPQESNSPSGGEALPPWGWGFMDLGMLQGGFQPQPGFSASLRSSSPRSSQILPWCPELSLPENLRWHRGHPANSRGNSRGTGASRREQRAGGTRCLSPQPPAPQSNKTTEGPRGDPGMRSRPGAGARGHEGDAGGAFSRCQLPLTWDPGLCKQCLCIMCKYEG